MQKFVTMFKSGIFPHYVLAQDLNSVKHPEQKIKYLKSKGDVISLMRGWYLQKNTRYSKFHLANLLYGPSYVTGISVLSWQGWISERVYTIHSATIKRGKTLDTPVGRFEYFHMNNEIFHYGIQNYNFGPGMNSIIATPTKAIFDHFIMTPHLQFSGKGDLLLYLENELRMDTNYLKDIDTNLLEKLMLHGQKKRQISLLYNLAKESS